VRRLEVAIGVETWAIESDGRLFEIAGGGPDVVYQVDGLPVVFEAEARAPGKRRSGLTGARPIELITLSPR
jgi:hypothetical protein